MVVSMTGFGRSKAESAQHAVTVEMKSVNHRFCEITIRMPRQLLKLEEKIKKYLRQYIKRGRVEIFVIIEGAGVLKRSIHVDWNLVEDYYQIINKLKEKYQLNGDIQISDFLRKEELMVIEEREEENEELENLVFQTIEEAVQNLMKMRILEGEQLQKDLQIQLNKIQAVIQKIQSLAPRVSKQYQERLEKKVKEAAADKVDEARILSEVAILADKADINEECVRLFSHIKQFSQLLDQDEPIGRRLDFIIQEMNREVNTIGSKANDSEIAANVIELKSCLEKMKEQVQNIE
jgi:uncharacterized protein (TIGR00255 family)